MESDPDKLLAMLRQLRTRPNLDPEEILAALTEMRELVPAEFRRRPGEIPETTSRAGESVDDEDFTWDAAREVLESFVAEVSAVAQAKRKTVYEKILDIYYQAEETARDPRNAGSLPQILPELEKMRRAFEKSYGHSIPTKEETERRRKREKNIE